MIKKIFRVLKASCLLVVRDAILNVVPPSPLVPTFARFLMYRLAGLDLHTHKIFPRCFFGGNKVSIGKGTFVSYGCFFDAVETISIGARCAIANEVCILTSTHAIGGPEERAGERIARPVRIGDGCWIGARAMFLPGVTVGDGCIVAAGAVVTKDCEANSLYAGVPAKLVKRLNA
jgi:maltose O-acetyltransferase